VLIFLLRPARATEETTITEEMAEVQAGTPNGREIT
jgi:hypothetical protein